MKSKKLSTTQIIAFGFLTAIVIGTFILCLPVCSASGDWTNPVDALFTATTSVCVTGLVVVQTSTYWSLFGKIVILLLIQLGGLGVVSFTTGLMMLIGQKITLSDRLLLEDALNLSTLRGLVRFLRKIFLGTFIVEGIGALGYLFVFIPEYGILRGIWYSVFHAVSAFCNAGIDILGDNSLMDYVKNPWMNFITMFLIIMGGLGFVVWMDIKNTIEKIQKNNIPKKKFFSNLMLHSKITLITTALLIVLGAVFILILEYDNPDTIGSFNFPLKLQVSFFQSVTTRTAGFFTISQKSLRPTTVLICLILMFIGGSSIGTAGGIKTSTFALLVLSAVSTIKGRRQVVAFGKTIPHHTIKKALAVTLVSILVLFVLTILLYQAEGGSMTDIVYETTSAIATVGLSRDLTASLNLWGKLIIILAMYLGRIGPISLAIIFGNRVKNAVISYPEENITVG